jgi:hypothetical protein
MRRNLLPRLVLAALLVAVPTFGSGAPPNQYQQFDRDATEIFDVQTQLHWQRQIQPKATLDGSATFCDLSFGVGRVPTVKELLTLIDEAPHQEYVLNALVNKMIDQNAFPDTPVDQPYWTTSPAGGGQVWTVNFSTGAMTAMAPTGQAYFRCVK